MCLSRGWVCQPRNSHPHATPDSRVLLPSQGPQLVVLVPTLELGVQITLLVYKLFGGNPSTGRVPGDAANMFRYTGPRGAKASACTT